MPRNLAQFDRHLASDSIAPVYLIAGAEDLLRLEAADAVRSRARAQGFAEREVFEVDARFDWGQLEASFGMLSLFASRRLLDVRLPTGKPGKDGAALIESYCRQPPPDLCLLITCSEWSRAHEVAWAKAVDAAGIFLPLWPLKPHELPDWLVRRLKQRGVDAEPAAIKLLCERVEGNLLAAAQEVDKLALLARGERLSAERLAALVADSARFDVFGMNEAALAGDTARALRMLAGLRAEGEQPVPVMNVIAGQVQLLNRLSAVQDAGGNLAQAMAAERVWDSRQPLYRKALDRLGRRGCERLLAACAELDRMCKGRAPGDPWQVMERVLAAQSSGRSELLAGA